MNTYKKYIIFFLGYLLSPPLLDGFSFYDNSGILDISNGTTLNMLSGNRLRPINGTIRRRPSGEILGSKLFFEDGVLSDGAFNISFTGTYDPSMTASVQMVSPSLFNGVTPGLMPYRIKVSGTDNTIEGLIQFQFDDAISFNASSDAVSIGLLTRLDVSPLLGSTINLSQDLVLGDNNTIAGSGTVNFNDFNLITGKKDLVWTSTLLLTNASNFELSSNSVITGRWTLEGACHFEGNGFILKMGPSGQISLLPGASLRLNNITIEGVKGNNINCMDCTGTLTFGNVLWTQDADFTFTNGAFDVLGLWELVGTSSFVFSPCRVCNVFSQGTIQLDKDMTFLYSPFVDNRDMLAFEDSSAVFAMNGATLASTFTGMRLTKGTLITESHCFLTQNTTVEPTLSESIEIGNGNPADELTIIIGPSSVLELLSGRLFYNQAE